MMDFQPSPYSNPAEYGSWGGEEDEETDGGVGWISAAIQGVSAIASTGIAAAAAKKQQERAGAQDAAMAEKQMELLALQTQVAQAQMQSNNAAAMIQSFASRKTLYMVGGLVLLGGFGALTAILLKRRAA